MSRLVTSRMSASPTNYLFYFFHPIYYVRTTLALPSGSNSDLGSHSGPSFPLPTTVHDFFYSGRNQQLVSCLVVSRRIVRTHAARLSQPLILFCIFANIFKISPRWELNSRTNGSSLRG